MNGGNIAKSGKYSNPSKSPHSPALARTPPLLGYQTGILKAMGQSGSVPSGFSGVFAQQQVEDFDESPAELVALDLAHFRADFQCFALGQVDGLGQAIEADFAGDQVHCRQLEDFALEVEEAQKYGG